MCRVFALQAQPIEISFSYPMISSLDPIGQVTAGDCNSYCELQLCKEVWKSFDMITEYIILGNFIWWGDILGVNQISFKLPWMSSSQKYVYICKYIMLDIRKCMGFLNSLRPQWWPIFMSVLWVIIGSSSGLCPVWNFFELFLGKTLGNLMREMLQDWF